MHSELLPPNLPAELAKTVFLLGTETGWSPGIAALAVEWFGTHGYATLGTELWVAQPDGIRSLPRGHDGIPGVFGNTVNRRKDESWDAFVVRSADETRTYLQSFNPSDIAEQGQQYFNIIWVSELEFNEPVSA